MGDLPNAAPIRLLAVPDSAPPYDGDVRADEDAGAPGSAPVAGTTAVPGSRVPAGSGVTDRAVLAGDQDAAGRPPGEPGTWPGQFAQILAETLAGSRPGGQIEPWTSAQARRHIRQLGPMLTAGAAPRIRRIVAAHPAAGVVEMAVVVDFGRTVRALAVRLERGPSQPRWVCTAVEAA